MRRRPTWWQPYNGSLSTLARGEPRVADTTRGFSYVHRGADIQQTNCCRWTPAGRAKGYNLGLVLETSPKMILAKMLECHVITQNDCDPDKPADAVAVYRRRPNKSQIGDSYCAETDAGIRRD